MALLATEAIVLHSFDYLESSRILRIVTRDAGVRSVLAKGARRSSRRFGSALDLFAQGSAQLYAKPGRDLDTLSGFDVTLARAELAGDLGRFTGASAVAELALRFGRDAADRGLFDAVAAALDALATAAHEDALCTTLASAWNIVAELGFGPAVDVAAGHIYWTNMGKPTADDGSIERADFDGQNRQTIVPQGGTFTPKQLQLEKTSGKLYWCDREGMRLMRANVDGSNIETLVDASQGDPRPGPDPTKWCVGVAIDIDRDQVYWTQKGADNAGKGRLFRAGIEIPTGQTASDRADIELLYDGFPSRSIWSSISTVVSFIGPTEAIHRSVIL